MTNHRFFWTSKLSRKRESVSDLRLQLHSRLSTSRANGPGRRSVIWVQGCTLACANCFNPLTHDANDQVESVSVQELVDWVISNDVDGLTISGGEPFQQSEGVLELSRLVRIAGLNVVILTGFTKAQVLSRFCEEVLRASVDVVIAGPYVESRHLAHALRGSTNKDYLIFSDVFETSDFDGLPESEIVINSEGSIVVTGINVPVLK